MILLHPESIVQLGPSPNPRLKSRSNWTKANTKLTFKPPPTHPHKLFSQKGLCYDFEILHRVNTHKKNKIWCEKKIWGTPAPLEVEFLGFPPMRMRASRARARGVFTRTDNFNI